MKHGLKVLNHSMVWSYAMWPWIKVQITWFEDFN
ncbi:hypothetical protein NC652_026388 [Populus alba x Populus x berolinensis]|nr:hypothetical protein NC651_025297 [Populus alba x Populus x berolinensis]KAJ6900245.1 hypothetical protein NC652_026388 [Populus alba x Populus x berolinensis]